MIIQKTLIDQESCQKRNVYLKNIKASFVESGDGFYDVVLEINSNKFFLSVKKAISGVEEFSIVCVKGFIELTNKLVFLLRNLINHLFLRINLV